MNFFLRADLTNQKRALVSHYHSQAIGEQYILPLFPLGLLKLTSARLDLTGSGGAISTGFLDATGSFSVSLLPSTSVAPLLGLPIHAQAGAYDASSLQVLTCNPVVRIFSL